MRSSLFPLPIENRRLEFLEEEEDEDEELRVRMKRAILYLIILLFISTYAHATLSYGNFEANTLYYNNVGTSDDGYFGVPHVVGDSIIFDPAGFGVQASGAGGIDFKDGTVLMTMLAKPGWDIDSVEIEEYGDYSLIGAGGLGTFAQVSGAAYLRVEEVDGVALPSPITFTDNMIYTPSAGDYNLFDDGSGLGVLWEGELKFDVDALLLGEGIIGKATKLHFTMDNTLVALSEDGTVSFIKKKEFGAFAVTAVPEPATLLMLGLGGLLLRRKRKF